MTEPKSEHVLLSSEEYVQRVATFLREASGWCKDRGLSVEYDVVTLREERMAEYEAPSLYISKEGVSLAKIVPVGSRIIGAQGRVDLIGRVTRHAFLFYVGKGPQFSTQTVVGGKSTSSSSTPMLSRVDREGWYWIEARVRRAKRVEENLFIDLFTDVSDYEFE
ncbi:hypothetical protein [Caballeronia sp. dw_19]|uniref:hypothetical protein n=1 Tax=Caballeronia sp. dw_19 TaxID=2719791 RepID=UPI001BD2D1AB|nr:hypothetical protein [Caballeronia sp. dw_19]